MTGNDPCRGTVNACRTFTPANGKHTFPSKPHKRQQEGNANHPPVKASRTCSADCHGYTDVKLLMVPFASKERHPLRLEWWPRITEQKFWAPGMWMHYWYACHCVLPLTSALVTRARTSPLLSNGELISFISECSFMYASKWMLSHYCCMSIFCPNIVLLGKKVLFMSHLSSRWKSFEMKRRDVETTTMVKNNSGFMWYRSEFVKVLTGWKSPFAYIQQE